MPWLKSIKIDPETQFVFDEFLGWLDAQLSDPAVKRNILCRDLLAQMLYSQTYEEVLQRSPVMALTLDPNNISFEAEYYVATDREKFGRVKPLLWLWKSLDISTLGQNPITGIPLRRTLARHIFKKVGRNFKCWQNVEFSVGYNMEVGDDVVIHRHVFLDDIGGIELHDRASVSDYVNIYSHTHSVIDPADVTLRRTVIGCDARVAYHATILAGSVVSDDAMLAAHALLSGDIQPHGIAMGLPARLAKFKLRETVSLYEVDSSTAVREPDQKPNPSFPYPTPTQTRSAKI